jgi:hypothetical protein
MTFGRLPVLGFSPHCSLRALPLTFGGGNSFSFLALLALALGLVQLLERNAVHVQVLANSGDSRRLGPPISTSVRVVSTAACSSVVLLRTLVSARA